MGAGPGDIGLLTVKAMETLRRADSIVYDRLVDSSLLAARKPQCKLIYVGKEPSHHPIPQEEIEQILVNEARNGGLVVRLKAGDPYVFGRGGEEGEVLYDAGIPFEVIPGITSAIGGLVYAGIPVTHRDYASSFHVITGHLKKGHDPLDWQSLARLEGTLVFLMGMTNLQAICEKLIRNGRSPETSVAVVEWASRSHQRSVVGDLTSIHEIVQKKGIHNPALIVVGDVVKLRPKLNFFESLPLFQQKILVPRARAGESKLARKIEELGGKAVEYPQIAVQEQPLPKSDVTFSNLRSYDTLIFMSSESVQYFFENLLAKDKDSRDLQHLHIVAVGIDVLKCLQGKGIQADSFCPRRSVQLLLDLQGEAWQRGMHILLVGSEELVHTFAEQLTRHAYVTPLPLYKEVRTTCKSFNLAEYNAICFGSSTTVQNLLTVLTKEEQQVLAQKKLFSIGQMTSQSIRDNGFTVHQEAKKPSIDEVIQLLIDDVKGAVLA